MLFRLPVARDPLRQEYDRIAAELLVEVVEHLHQAAFPFVPLSRKAAEQVPLRDSDGSNV